MSNKLTDGQLILSYDFERTKLANQTTYMSFITASLIMGAFAFNFKRYYVSMMAMLLVIIATIQYYIVDYNLNNGLNPDAKVLKYIPISVTIFILLTFIIEIYEIRRFRIKFKKGFTDF